MPSRFSSPCETNTVLPLTTTPVLIARLAATKLQTFSPVCGLIAWIAPSPSPAMSSRMPLIVAMSGAAYAVSYGRPPGFDDVDDVAGPLVERDEAMRAVAGRAPVRDGGADDDQVAVDERRHRPAAVRRERGELLAERAVPQQLAVAAERDDLGAAAERVDVAGLRIGRGRGPADAVRRHVALEQVELVFPDHLAGVGVERHHALLQVRAAAGRVLHVDAIAHDDRRRASAVRARATGSSRR